MSDFPLMIKNNEDNIISLEIPTPFPVGAVNLYLILGDKLTLVDTGPKTELAWKSLIYQLNMNGLRIKDIDQIILTHHHVDHSGLLSILLEHHPNLKVYAHEATVPWVEKRKNVIEQMIHFYENLYLENGLAYSDIIAMKKYHDYFEQYFDPVKIDHILHDGMELEGHSDWSVMHNPGHAQGHISLYHQNTGTLIAGDHLIEHISSGTFIEPPFEQDMTNYGVRPKIVIDYKDSLERMLELNLNRVLSGHGKVITNPNSIIAKELNKFEQRAEKILSHLNNHTVTVYDLMKLAYPNRYDKHLHLFFSEVLGTLDLLESQGKVSTIKEKGLVKYYIAKHMM